MYLILIPWRSFRAVCHIKRVDYVKRIWQTVFTRFPQALLRAQNTHKTCDHDRFYHYVTLLISSQCTYRVILPHRNRSASKQLEIILNIFKNNCCSHNFSCEADVCWTPELQLFTEIRYKQNFHNHQNTSYAYGACAVCMEAARQCCRLQNQQNVAVIAKV